jgi:hypothetical protein
MESQTIQGKEPRLLPIVKLHGIEYLVDIEQREFREFKNPDNVINMHSEKGRQIVNEIVGGQWNSFGVDSYPRKGMEV